MLNDLFTESIREIIAERDWNRKKMLQHLDAFIDSMGLADELETFLEEKAEEEAAEAESEENAELVLCGVNEETDY